MSELTPQGPPPPAGLKPQPDTTFAEFLESSSTETEVWVSGAVKYDNVHSHPDLLSPDIRIHCWNDDCNGIRTFGSGNAPTLSSEYELEFLTYVCRNCRKSVKYFSLLVRKDTPGKPSSARVMKLGELPSFGPPIPPRLITLVGGDRELFLKGRRAELRGLGIGAFAYYRRVVEEQKGRIIHEIGKVAERLGAPPETLKLFTEAEKETQFSNAIEKIKAAIPESIRVNGHNPLTLLHTALSNGLHKQSDEVCLEVAHDIRLVLTELAERISAALKEEAELRGAVNRLLKSDTKKLST